MLNKFGHATYDALANAARKGNPLARRAKSTVDEGRKSLIATAKRNGTPMARQAVEETLAQAVVASSPWLETAISAE